MSEFELSSYQRRVMLIPEGNDIALLGGRGSGKSVTMALLALRHIEQHGRAARVLYIRKTHRGCDDFVSVCFEVLGQAYGGAKFNASERQWKFPSGAVLEIGQLEAEQDYRKYQGRSFTLLMADECQQYGTPRLLDMLRSNLRGPKGTPLRVVLAGNPGDIGHSWISGRFVFGGAAPWVPFTEKTTGTAWVHAPGTFSENPFIDREEYHAQLRAACGADSELLRAWVEGDWSVSRGAFFADTLSETRSATDPWPKPLKFLQPGGAMLPWQRRQIAKQGGLAPEWDTFLSFDHGCAAPAVALLMARSPGGLGPDNRWYPRGSLIAFGELATVQPGEDLNRGNGWTIPTVAAEIRRLCADWGVAPSGCADDACFARTGSGAGSLADEYAAHGVSFLPAKKADRKTGWAMLRRMLEDAGKPDRAGLYISRECRYLWATLPYLTRDPKRPDDLDTRTPDHGADALRYACTFERQAGGVSDTLIRWAY